MFKKRYFLFLFFKLTVCFAAPPDNGPQGKLIFLGVNHNSSNSVWLSLTTAAGSFQLEGPGNELVDEWTQDQRGLRLSLSPVVSQGNGGTHHLINAANNKTLDSQNQQGGIVFPPFQPGTPTHPIVIPPASIPPAGNTSSGSNQIPSNYSPQNNMTGNFDQSVPITPARQFDEDAWNV